VSVVGVDHGWRLYLPGSLPRLCESRGPSPSPRWPCVCSATEQTNADFILLFLPFFRMLQDLESGVDETDNKLSGAMKKMRRFVRQTEQEKSGWCIIILIVVLMLLLLLVIVI